MGIKGQYDLANETAIIQIVSGALANEVYNRLNVATPTADDGLLGGMCLREPEKWARRFALLIAQVDTVLTAANAETRVPLAMPLAWPIMVWAAKREDATKNG